MPKLILNISFMGGMLGRPFTLAAFYVMISRVRRFAGLRLLSRDEKAMGKLLELKPDEYLHAFENGWENGAWDGKCAWAVLIALRRDRSKAAAKAAEEKAAAKKDAAKATAAARREAAEEKAAAKKDAAKATAAARREAAEGKAAAKKDAAKVTAAARRENVVAVRSAKAKAKKDKTAVVVAAAARARMAEGQPSAKRYGGASARQHPRTPSTGSMARVGTVVAGRSRGHI